MPIAAVEDGEIVVRGQIVRIDSLQRLELFHGFVVAMLLVIGDAQFAARIARLRILRDHLLQIGDLRFGMPLPPLHQTPGSKARERRLA